MVYEFTRWPAPEEVGLDDPDVRLAWHERVAICILDGGLDEHDARARAWREIGYGSGPSRRRPTP